MKLVKRCIKCGAAVRGPRLATGVATCKRCGGRSMFNPRLRGVSLTGGAILAASFIAYPVPWAHNFTVQELRSQVLASALIAACGFLVIGIAIGLITSRGLEEVTVEKETLSRQITFRLNMTLLALALVFIAVRVVPYLL